MNNQYKETYAPPTMDCVSEGTFSGTIYTKNEWTGTFDELFSAASVTAILLPKGYESYHYLSINDNNTEAKYDDYVRTSDDEYTLATSKAAGVEQFSYESAKTYSSGFALSPENAILNFTITDGSITATGGYFSAGIGAVTCGKITITGGTIIANGSQYGAGIGSGRGIENNYWKSNCGNITISNTVTKVTATKGSDAANSIGKGDSTFSTCGIVTIGDVEGAISTSPYTYPAS